MSARWQRRIGTAFVVASWWPRYVCYAWLRKAMALPRVAAIAWSAPTSSRDPAAEARTVACVHRLRQIVAPRGGDCLPYSLVLYHALSQRGAAPTLHVGFRRGANGVEGHAWITADDVIVGDTAEHIGTYERAFSFGNGGARVPLSADAGAPGVAPR